MNEIKYPDKRTFWKITSADGKTVIHDGVTEINQVTSTGQPIMNADTKCSDIFPVLPDNGELTEGKIYSYDGDMVIVRQTHVRTIYSPKDTPALFQVFRANTEGAEWIANESVIAGDTRTFNDKLYKCLQSHNTQQDWIPDKTPALWEEVITETEEKPPQWVSGDYYKYKVGTQVYNKGQIWEAINLTHTWIEPALSGNGAISWKFVKDWVE